MTQPVLTTSRTDEVRSFLQGLQSSITSAIAKIDGGAFLTDTWEKAPGEMLQGNGITQILEGGDIFERADKNRDAAKRVGH